MSQTDKTYILRRGRQMFLAGTKNILRDPIGRKEVKARQGKKISKRGNVERLRVRVAEQLGRQDLADVRTNGHAL